MLKNCNAGYKKSDALLNRLGTLQNVPNTDSKSGLQATWGFGNQLFIFPGKKANLDSGKYF